MDKRFKLVFFILSFFLVIVVLFIFFGEREEENDEVRKVEERDLLSRLRQEYPDEYLANVALEDLENVQLVNFNGTSYWLLPSLWAPDKSTPFLHVFNLDGTRDESTG